MPATALPCRGPVGHLTLRGYVSQYVREVRGSTPDGDADLIRAWAGLAGWSDLDHRVNSWLQSGYAAASDSLAGVYATVPLPNYLTHQVSGVSTPATVLPIGRGDMAPSLQLAVSVDTWHLAKFGVAFEICEEDLLDSQDTLDTLALAVKEMGSAFRRAVLDALWGTLLANPSLSDGVALFDATRSNLGAAALSGTAIGIAMGAIGGQTRQITPDATINAHDNLEPGVLIVPPALAVTAHTAVAGMTSGATPPLSVRLESRLSTDGFLDPAGEVARAGNGTNWMLAAKADQAPAIVLGTLNGAREPALRSGELTAGRWGRWYDATLSLGCKAIDGRPVYWSTGAA